MMLFIEGDVSHVFFPESIGHTTLFVDSVLPFASLAVVGAAGFDWSSAWTLTFVVFALATRACK